MRPAAAAAPPQLSRTAQKLLDRRPRWWPATLVVAGRPGSQIAESYHLRAPVRALWLSTGAGAGWRLRVAARRPPSVSTYYINTEEGVRHPTAAETRRRNIPNLYRNRALRGIANSVKAEGQCAASRAKRRWFRPPSWMRRKNQSPSSPLAFSLHPVLRACLDRSLWRSIRLIVTTGCSLQRLATHHSA